MKILFICEFNSTLQFIHQEGIGTHAYELVFFCARKHHTTRLQQQRNSSRNSSAGKRFGSA